MTAAVTAGGADSKKDGTNGGTPEKKQKTDDHEGAAAVSSGAGAVSSSASASGEGGAEGENLTLKLRNVAGTMEYTVTVSAAATLAEFRRQAISSSPAEGKDKLVFTFVHKNKIVKDSTDVTLANFGFCDNDLVVVVTKPSS